MLAEAERLGVREIGLPRIGAGLGGLDWDDVLEVLYAVGGDTPIDLKICDEYVGRKPMVPIEPGQGSQPQERLQSTIKPKAKSARVEPARVYALIFDLDPEVLRTEHPTS
jgi:hypothetical protein